MLSRTSPHVGHPLIHQLFWILFVIAAIAALVYIGVDVVGDIAASWSEQLGQVGGVGGR